VRGIDAIEIREGDTRLLVPEKHVTKGPGRRGGVFYNRQMRFNRDISIIFFHTFQMRGKRALDGMAGTGARGVRLANEVPGSLITINDRDPEAYSLIKSNIELNGLDCQATNEDIRCLVLRGEFDYVDIDPFGTPVPFLPASIQGLRRGGVIAATATDTAPLSGAHPRKCARRYGAKSGRCRFSHEVGLRILIGHIVREAARYDRGVRPLLCFYADHYFRVHLSMIEGAAAADRSLAAIGFIEYDRDSGRRSFFPDASSAAFGPLWGGPLIAEDIRRAQIPGILAERARCERYLSIWKEELNVPYFYETDELASLLGGSPPPLSLVIDRLREEGKASRTHFSPTGFKTDLEHDEILHLLSDLV